MPIDTRHPEYLQFAPIWRECADALAGQRVIRAADERYLPKTSGMAKNADGLAAYTAYKSRARFFDVPAESQEGALGVLEFPASDDVVTNNGLTIRQLAREVARAVYAKGRHILVIEANNGTPYIVQYSAEALINWKTDENDALSLAVFRETIDSADEYEHGTEEEQFRAYKPDVVELDGEFITINYPQIPVVIIGATDCSPSCDRPPVHRIAECAIAAYKKSANYEQALYLMGQPTPAVSGVNEEEYTAICNTGLGAGALLHLGENGKIWYLEYSGAGIASMKEAIEDELAKAAEYAVRLTQTAGVESAAAKGIRDAAQKSALAAMADSISIGITRALQIRAKWGGLPEPEPYVVGVQDATQAEATMITAIGNRVNAGGYPAEVEYNYAVKAGMFTGTVEEWNDKRSTGV